MTATHTTAAGSAAIAALRDARADADDLIRSLENRIENHGLDGDALLFERGRWSGAKTAQMRINNLIEEIEMGRHELGDTH